MNVFSMDGADQDCLKAWGGCLASKLGYQNAFVCTAWSGKGIVKNAPMCGETCLPDLWSSHRYTLVDEPPRLIAILAGGNDFFSESFPTKDEFQTQFSEFLHTVRKIRGNSVPIYVFQCSASCCSSAGSPSVHPSEDEWAIKSSKMLHENTLNTVSGIGDDKIVYHQIDIKLDLNTDYATMMHWSPCGHEKIAQSMAQFIARTPFSAG
jgi:lysophospholipase L1-like esterase